MPIDVGQQEVTMSQRHIAMSTRYQRIRLVPSGPFCFFVAVIVVLSVGLCDLGLCDSKELRRRAEQGDAKAQNSLALLYVQGKGVPQDFKQSTKWFRKAAEQGHDEAQFNLGVAYSKGEGVPRDHKQAVQWYR